MGFAGGLWLVRRRAGAPRAGVAERRMTAGRTDLLSRRIFLAGALIGPALPVAALAQTAARPVHDTALDDAAAMAMGKLTDNQWAAAATYRARAVLVFPQLANAGGTLSGDGALRTLGRETAGYYRWAGPATGAARDGQGLAYALMLMTDEALDYVRRTPVWRIGAGGPRVVGVDLKDAERLSRTADAAVYGFAFRGSTVLGDVRPDGTTISRR
jgi:hypothetical protein